MRRKVTFVVLLATFVFLWFLTGYDSNITSMATKDVIVYEGGGFCGDSIRQLGEDCSNCPTDIKCSERAYCDDGVCIPKEIETDYTLIYIILIIMAFFGVSLSVYLILRGRKKKKEKKEVKKVPKEEKENKIKEKKIITNYDELESYIEKALKMNYNKGEIREFLLKSGWKEEDVDFALRQFNQK